MKGQNETKRILCIEDNEDTCELMKTILANFDVVCAATVRAATQAYQSTKWALLIVDEHLFDGSGLEWIRRVRKSDMNTAIVVISGDPDVTASDVKIAGGQLLLKKQSRTFVEDLCAAVERFAMREP